MAVATAEAQNQAIERGYQRLSSIFKPQVLEGKICHRCKKQVYHAEKIGPVNGVLFHKACFKCLVCGQHLTMKNYWTNQTDPTDREVYCNVHVPRIGGSRLDQGAMGIKNAVKAQEEYKRMSKKQNQQIRMPGTLRKPNYTYEAVAIKRATSVPKPQQLGQTHGELHKGASIDKDAMHIKGPVEAQLLRQGYQRKLEKHHYPPNIYKKRKKLIDAQKRLEEEHRREEDKLLQEFHTERKTEVQRLSEELKQEWEVKLKELTDKFDKEMQKNKKKLKDNEKKQMTVNFENQKRELEVVISEKKKKKTDTMTLRLKEREQKKTATMVTRQSKQMLEMLAQEQERLKQELQQEIQAETKQETNGEPEPEELEEALEALEITPVGPKELPPPHPPSSRKKELYEDVKVFQDVDEQTIKVAQDEQTTYTDLIQQLTGNLVTDLEKVRAIYRWVTVKDLNEMEFEESLSTDTPMGLLRGIKLGTETYHVLFMRLCSYAGIHCVEIKGHSKSVGYEPGMKIKPEMFQNTWNAALVDGDWRLVQCNWGARHLVLNKDKRGAKVEEKEKPKSKDQIRYQYDEHYFLTDPDEFIQEFWAIDKEWQLLENSITLEEFEAIPFVRSIFFHHRMRFERGMTAVLETSEKGGVDIKIKIPEELENDLVFFYQMRFAEKERRQEATYRGAALERFIYQTMVDNTVMFSVHVPTTGEFFFEIFANKIEESNRISNDDSVPSISPFRLKCACKFKIVCNSLSGKMHPLPDCASGEWGPKKGSRHFGMKLQNIVHPNARSSPEPADSTTDQHSDSGSSYGGQEDAQDNPKAGIINVEESVELKFKVPRPLHFVAKLKMNQVETKTLEPFVHTGVEDGVLTVRVTPPQIGQFGLDIYARPKEADESTTLSHAMKYLVNALKVSNPVEIPKVQPKNPQTSKEKWGALPLFDDLGLKVISPKDPKISLLDVNQCSAEIYVPDNVLVSHKFIREPEDEMMDKVTLVKDEKDPRKYKYQISLPKTGNYMLCLFACRKNDETKPNVFNFLIIYKKNLASETNGTPPKTEERRGSSLFKKNFFKKSSEKDKGK
ncbi:hypothetical protein FSP39_021331 [Pinctada imbricata]|uniref:LIM zinc-binding domain-containing protein n=1 Tax=Pinctada imbricata TaxID=66713 RepID=A0AA88Y2Z9_PINIB|nr:hypothetical protein FSP39_021331 [Pinctada imbricata]